MAPPLVLIIEDDALVAQALEFVVEEFGYAVCCASAEDAAVEKLAGRCPDLILSDWRLAEGRTGGEAIAFIRRNFGHDIPALVLTGESSPSWFREIQALALDVFLKPVDLDRLRTAIEGVCGPPPSCRLRRCFPGPWHGPS